MNQSKLLQLLRSLSPEEFKRFARLLYSPFFNTNPTQIKLYDLLKKEYPDFNSPKLSKEKLFRKLFPGKDFHYHSMANLLSEMSRLVEEYLIQLEIEQEAFQKRSILIKALGRRNKHHLFIKASHKLIEDMNRLPYKDAAYYLQQLELRSEQFFHPLSNQYQLDNDHPKQMMDSLDQYYVLKKLQWSAVLKTKERLLATEYPVRMLDEVLELGQKSFSEENPLFSIYSNIYHLQEASANPDHFYKTKKLLSDHLPTFREKDQKDVLWHLINYAVRQINLGAFNFNREALDLYQLGLEYNLLLENGKLSEATFNNIVSIAGVLKEFVWAYSFINRYGQFLEENVQENINALSIGELKFREQYFDEVINKLTGKQFSKILHQIKARNLLLKSWFEKFLRDESYYELLIAQIESFEKYIKRNKKLSETKVESYLNFLRLIRKIALRKSQLKLDYNFKTKISDKINKSKSLIGKHWLKNRVEQL